MNSRIVHHDEGESPGRNEDRVLVRFVGGGNSVVFAVGRSVENHVVWRLFLGHRMIASVDFDELEVIVAEHHPYIKHEIED